MTPIALLGAGSWGTALAVHLGRSHPDVRLWARDALFADAVQQARRNPKYLSDVELPPSVRATSSLPDAVAGARFIVLTVPSHGARSVMSSAAPFVPHDAILVSAMKGLEERSLARLSQVLASEAVVSRPIVVLSGPSFASEVAHELPTAVLAASTDTDAAALVQEQFRGRTFRIYVSDDVAGVEIGGALKNVIAIAAGCVEGLALGHNAMAALITRGLAEISRLACAEGGRRETLAGLSGLGDLVLTCTGDLSRNRHVGVELGRGRQLPHILENLGMVAEGVRTTGAALALGSRHGIELPIALEMDAVLRNQRSPAEAVEALMGRRQRAELDG